MVTDNQIFYAHSTSSQPGPDWQLLRDHLTGVAKLAHDFAAATGSTDLPPAAEAAGWLHDLGKYRASFQRYICGLPPMGSKQHKEAGAAWAAKAGDLLLVFAILGHHHGMPDRDKAKSAVKGSDGLDVVTEVQTVAERECPELKTLALAKRGEMTAATELLTRLLLSCLVDADWTDTSEHERHFKRWPAFPIAPALEPAVRLDKLLAAIEAKAATMRPTNPKLADIRQQILHACLTTAEQPKGLFTLTVPTGGGKTLSGLAFALKHAVMNQGLRRVIYVAPYISILEQNASVIREALGIQSASLELFEHQSLAEPLVLGLADEKQTATAARLAENWDSPIIVTTNVQFFESLFSNKPGQCRKLHNIAGSVVILDECQSLPPDLVKPTCQMLKQLVDQLGCTIVLCTATQPAFDHETLKEYRLTAQAIIPQSLDLFAHLKRVQLKWPSGRDERLAWCDVAKQMHGHQSALCVVNTKAAAIELFNELKLLKQNVYHLSTSMCPAHRTAVLDTVKRRLNEKKPVFVVCTQLIEAGVDIDFPAVFRELGPLESIIQAAGRCNREGRISNAGGQVIVFRSVNGNMPPDRWYQAGRDTLETWFLNAGHQPQIDDPGDISAYYTRLYWSGELDPKNIVGLRAGFQFESVAEKYKLIATDTVPVVVATWQDHATEIESLLDTLKARPNRANFRALAPFQVNIYRTELAKLPGGLAVPLSEDLDLLVWRGNYDPNLGRTSESQDLIDAI